MPRVITAGGHRRVRVARMEMKDCSKTILIVCGDRAFAADAGAVIEAMGCPVLRARTGSEAIDTIRNNEPALVVIGCDLGDMSAGEVVRSVGDMPPFIVVSGDGNEKVAIEAMKVGARCVLFKGAPLMEELPRAVRDALGAAGDEARVRAVEEKARAAAEKLDLITENTDARFVVVSPEYRIVWASGRVREAFGEIDGGLCYRMLHNRDAACHICGVREVLEKGADKFTYEKCVTDSGGVESWWKLTAVPLKDDKGGIISVLEIEVPLTDSKNAERMIRESSAKLREMARREVVLCDIERKKLARDLHDHIGQKLTILLLDLALLRKDAVSESDKSQIDDIIDTAGQIGNDMQRICGSLRPLALDAFGLEYAVRRLVDSLNEEGGLSVSCEIANMDDSGLDAGVEMSIYRILQEAIENVKKHSGAGHVSVSMRCGEGGDLFTLEVADDGKGMAADAINGGGGFGLLGMKERAAFCGGRMEIDAAPGQGVRLLVSIPCGAKGIYK